MTQKEFLDLYKIDLDNTNEANFDGLFDILTNYEIATEKEIFLLTCINGRNIQTLLDIIYARCGLRSIEQLVAELAE